MSAPLKGRPKLVRDTMGWLSLNTLFLGGCVWLWLIFVRQPALQQTHAASFDFHEGAVPELPDAPKEDAHGKAEDDGHGAAKKDDGHGAKKDDGHGAKKDDGHGAKKAPAKKDAHGAAKKKPAKKDAKKDAGHGGGH
ncbi:MAG: hypothetical protein ACOYN0_04825 [Phycisphaerales bacterium]